MHLGLSHLANVPTCIFHIILIVVGTKTKALVAEETNIIIKGSITGKQLPSSNTPCKEVEPRKRVASPCPGYVKASSTLTTICSLKYMGHIAA